MRILNGSRIRWSGLVLAAAYLLSGGVAYAAYTQQQLYQMGINYYDAAGSTGCGSSDISLVGSDTPSKIWNFLISKGLQPYQAAGALGNLEQESGGKMDPKALEANGSGTDGYTGHGIVQWSWTRWRTDYGLAGPKNSTNYDGYPGGSPAARGADAAKTSDLTDFAPYPPKGNLDPKTLLGFAAQQDAPWYDLGIQVAFMWSELQPGGSYQQVLANLKATTDVTQATEVWGKGYEGFGDNSMPTRLANAQAILTQYGGGAAASSPTLSNSTSTPASGGCAAAVDCSSFSTTAIAGADTSQLRQNVVCLAENELATVWTPLPSIPRMQYLKYSDGAEEEWCADFVSWLYNQAGYPFTGGQSGGWRIAAVSDIWSIGTQNQKFHFHSSDGSYTPRPGDLAIHKGDGVSHVNMVISVSGNTVTLIGGDQGPGPYGGPDSASIVSKVTQQSFSSSSTIGYVSPDN